MEVTGLSPSETRHLTSEVNRLAVACRDEVLALDAAAHVLPADQAAVLTEQSRERRQFISELRGIVTKLGGQFVNRASHLAHVRAGMHRLRGLVIGPNAGDEYAICTHAETVAEELYTTLLAGHVPAGIRLVLEAQHDAIERDRSDLRRRRFLH